MDVADRTRSTPSAGDPHGLSPMERAFVSAMFGAARCNATEAAKLAGYKSDNRRALAVTAHRLMHRRRVRAAIGAELERTTARA